MKIIKLQFKVATPVTSLLDLKDAEDIKKLIDGGFSRGNYSTAFALSHCEVCENPLNYFVVSQKLVDEKIFKSRVVVNPIILEYDEKLTVSLLEACMSVPFRRPKRMERYLKIKVKYQIIEGEKLSADIVEEVDGVKAHIFQHQCDHNNGLNIYFDKP